MNFALVLTLVMTLATEGLACSSVSHKCPSSSSLGIETTSTEASILSTESTEINKIVNENNYINNPCINGKYICKCKDGYEGERCETQVDTTETTSTETTSTETASAVTTSTEINEITGGTILSIEGTIFKLKRKYSTPVNVRIYWNNEVEGEFDWTFTSKREDVNETNFKIDVSQENFSLF